MLSLRKAVATAAFSQPLRQALTTAARMGSQGIQLDCRHELKPREFSGTAQRAFRTALREANLEVASLRLPLRRPLHDSAHLQERMDALRMGMELAPGVGARALTLSPGPIPARDDASWATLVDILDDLASHGNHVGTTICLTSGSAAADDLSTLVQEVSQGPVAVDFDPAASQASGRDPLDDFRRLYEQIGHIRARDVALASDGRSEEVPVGQGSVPWMELMIMLSEVRYAGWVVLDRTRGESRISDVAAGLSHLTNRFVP